MKEFESTRLGPSSYEVSYKLTEKRDDFGIVKIKKPYFTIIEEEEDDERPELHPNYDFDKPNKLVFKYHEPLKGLGPAHTPEKELNPGKWIFYDYDLDAIREQVGKEIAFAKGLEPAVFKEKEEFHEMLVEHLKRQEKRPAVGQYNTDLPDTQIPIDFGKAVGRDLGPESVKNLLVHCPSRTI